MSSLNQHLPSSQYSDNRDKTELIRYPNPPPCLTDSKPPIEAAGARAVKRRDFARGNQPILRLPCLACVCVLDEKSKRDFERGKEYVLELCLF